MKKKVIGDINFLRMVLISSPEKVIKKIVISVIAAGIVLNLTACGKYEAMVSDNRESTVNESTVSGSVMSGSARIKEAEKLPIKEEKQWEIIARNWKQWDVSYLSLPGENAEEEEKLAFMNRYEFSVVDLDFDGYMEIITFSRTGTGGHNTDVQIYEVKEDGSGLSEWSKTGDEDNEADWHEYPMKVYYDTDNACWHYNSCDSIHASAADTDVVSLDLSMKDNQVKITEIKGEKSYYQSMEPFLLFYNTECCEYDSIEEVGADVDMESMIWELEDLWYSFEIQEDRQDFSSEKKLTDSEKDQLRKIAGSSLWYSVGGMGEELGEFNHVPLSYMVTDLDEDGQLEIIKSSIQGSGQFSYTEVYEVSKDAQKLIEIKIKDQREGSSSADISKRKKVSTYWDEKNKVRYYMFDDYCHVSAQENFNAELAVALQKNQWVEKYAGKWKKTDYEKEKTAYYIGEKDEKVSKKEYDSYVDKFWRNMKKGEAVLGWKESCEANLYRMNEDYLYHELADSFLSFQIEE